METLSYIVFLIVFFGYTIFGLILNYFFYHKQSNEFKKWKINIKKTERMGKNFKWWIPSGGEKLIYRTIKLLNLFLAGCAGMITTEIIMRGKTLMYSDISEYSLGYYLTISTFMPHIFQGVIEYWWHRMMHLKFFYQHFHKFHHHYTSPQPFDDMFIHPLEAIGYYIILWGSPLIVPVHSSSFILYMIVCGITGVTDHSGIKMKFLNIYNTQDHDLHHSAFNYNYSFPFPLMDILFKTYQKPSEEKN